MVEFSGTYKIIPCHLHFMMYDCEKEWFCHEADDDSQGIHVIHGYKHLFHKEYFWNELYRAFENVSVLIV